MINRRLTWREIRAHFETLRTEGLASHEASRCLLRLRRARSQLVPICGWMVVSPYEAERELGLAVLGHLGGQASAKMLDDLVANSDVYAAFKPPLQALATKLREKAAGTADDDQVDEVTDGDGEATEAGGPERVGRGPRPKRRSASGDATEATEPRRRTARKSGRTLSATEAAKLFTSPDEAFLAALDGPMDPLISAFWQLKEAKRVSFVDRLAKITDQRLGPFLSTLLASDQRALVQSALAAIAGGRQRGALEGVKGLLARENAKSIRQRAESTLAALEGTSEASAESVETPSADGQRRRPRQKNEAVRSRAGDLGVALLTVAQADEESSAPLEPTERLPRLINCLAGGVGLSGQQEIVVYRADPAGGQSRLRLTLDAAGWRSAHLASSLPEGIDRADLEAAEGRMVEVTMAYGRRRVQQAAKASAAAELALPAQAAGALAWLGSGKRVEVADETEPGEVAPMTSAQARVLLDGPLWSSWRLAVAPTGQAVGRWQEARSRKEVSRHRKVIVDDALTALLELLGVETIAEHLRLQATLLRRSGADEAADQVVALAAGLSEQTLTTNPLLREVAYRSIKEAAALAPPAAKPAEPEPAITAEPGDEKGVDESAAEAERSTSRRSRWGRRRRGGSRRASDRRSSAERTTRRLIRARRRSSALRRATTARRLAGLAGVRRRRR